MSPVGKGELSLTKFYRLRELVGELASVKPGMGVDDVRDVLGSGHKELADDLVLYRDGAAVDDPLLGACRAKSVHAPLLLWVALVMADHRLAAVVEGVLTGSNGLINEAEFDTARLEERLKAFLPNMGTRKAATNILSYYRDSGMVQPETLRKTIVGVESTRPTDRAVPAVIRYVGFRLAHLGLTPAGADDVTRAVNVRANRWMNLSVNAFRAAAGAESAAVAPAPAPLNPPAGVRGVPTKKAAPKGGGALTVTEVPVEAQNADRFTVAGHAEHQAEKREQPLVLAYKKWMEAKNSKVVRFRFKPEGEADGIYCDLYDKTRNNLIEAKATAGRFSVRMAVGQLLDYRRYMEGEPGLGVLTPTRPSADLEALLTSLGIVAVWSEGPAFIDNGGGSFS